MARSPKEDLMFFFPYLRGAISLAHRLLPVLTVAIFLGIVWLDLGAGLNVPALVWHDNWILQGAAGWSISWLFVYAWLITYLLDARFHPEFIRSALERSRKGFSYRFISFLLPSTKITPETQASSAEFREGSDGLRWYLAATFFPCVLLLILPAFFVVDTVSPFIHFTNADSTPPNRPYIFDRWPFLAGVGLTIFSIRLVNAIGVGLRKQFFHSDRHQKFLHVYWLHFIAFMLLFLLAGLYAFMCYTVNRNTWHPPPVMSVCMLFGLAIGIMGLAWFHLRYAAIPLLLALIGWMAYCNYPDYKLRFPHMEAEYANIINLEDFEEPANTLAEIDLVTEDRAQAEREEIERVARVIACIQAQRDPSKTVDQYFKELMAKDRTKPEKYNQLVRQYGVLLRRLESDEMNALRIWRDQFKGKVNDDRPKLVIVTATGGANRSGLWTCKVLNELHQNSGLSDFSKHLRIIAGASGGLVGASYYVGSVQENGSLQEGFQPEDIAQDFLTPIINSLVFREIPLLTIPVQSYDRDRGEALDRAMEGDIPNVQPAVRQRLSNVFTRSFADWAPGEKAGWRPSIIYSPMVIEDGRRLLISNRHIPFMTVSYGDFLLPNRPNFGQEQPNTDGSTRVQQNQMKGRPTRRRKQGSGTEDVYSRPAIEFFRLFPEARDRFHVSTAARMNATFPFVSPAVSIPVTAPRRIVDAGYFDNTGVSVASSWLYNYREWIADNCSGVVIIQIRDFTSHQENRNLSFPRKAGGSYLPGLTGPLSAVDHARSASANYRNDADLQQLGDYFKDYFDKHPETAPKKGLDQFFTTVVFERYTDVGMNWYLSKEDKQDILDSWDKGEENMNPASVQKLRTWWNSR
jgi:hypothetical protein